MANSNLILDTNLLILLIVGNYDPNFISNCDLTSSYNKDDFQLLKRYLKLQSSIYITPEILAELSNQSFFLKDPKLRAYQEILVYQLTKIKEKYIPLGILLNNTEMFFKFGFTDLSIYELAKKEGYVVLTDDFKLHNILSTKKINTLSFNHIRGMVWDL